MSSTEETQLHNIYEDLFQKYYRSKNLKLFHDEIINFCNNIDADMTVRRTIRNHVREGCPRTLTTVVQKRKINRSGI